MEESKKLDGSEGLAGLFGDLGAAIKKHKEDFTFGTDLKFPIEISGVKCKPNKPTSPAINGAAIGDLVSIRPCGKWNKESKTFVGLFLGDWPIENLYEFEKKTKILHIRSHGNPAIFVFDLKRIVFGCESWWGKIENEEQLKKITDEDINNIWYVKLLKEMQKEKS